MVCHHIVLARFRSLNVCGGLVYSSISSIFGQNNVNIKYIIHTHSVPSIYIPRYC